MNLRMWWCLNYPILSTLCKIAHFANWQGKFLGNSYDKNFSPERNMSEPILHFLSHGTRLKKIK